MVAYLILTSPNLLLRPSSLLQPVTTVVFLPSALLSPVLLVSPLLRPFTIVASPSSNITQPFFSSIVSPSSFHIARTFHLPAQVTAPVSPSFIQFGNVFLPLSSSPNLPNLPFVTSTQATLLIPPPPHSTQSNSQFFGQQPHPTILTDGLYNNFPKSLSPWVNSQAFLPSQSLKEMLQKNINDRWSSLNNGLPYLQSSVLTVSSSQLGSSPPSHIPQPPSLLSACAAPPPPSIPSTSLTFAASSLLSIPPFPSSSVVTQPSSTLPAQTIPLPKDRQSLPHQKSQK